VRVTLNYQAIPPSYLRDRFTIGNGAETQRLAYLTSHLNLDRSPIEGGSCRSFQQEKGSAINSWQTIAG